MSTRSSSPSTYRAPTSLREAFRMHLGTEYAENTINAYVAAITQFYHFLNGLNPLRATMNHIRAYLFYLIHELGYAAQTYNQHFYGLRAFYETFMPDVPIMDAFGRRRTPQGDIKVVSRFEFERMVSRTDNLKHRAVLVLLYSSGIRANECAHIKIEDFDPERMVIRVKGKGDKVRHTIFSRRCREVLREYVREYRPESILFPGRNKEHISKEMIGHIVREAAKRAEVKKRVSPHTLRHSFATHFLETDGRLPVLQAMLGHSHPKTTYRYCHVETAMLRTVTSPLDVAIEQFGPRPRERGRK